MKKHLLNMDQKYLHTQETLRRNSGKWPCETCGELLTGHSELVFSETGEPIPVMKYYCRSRLNNHVYSFMVPEEIAKSI
jgi:hypothetical protein